MIGLDRFHSIKSGFMRLKIDLIDRYGQSSDQAVIGRSSVDSDRTKIAKVLAGTVMVDWN